MTRSAWLRAIPTIVPQLRCGTVVALACGLSLCMSAQAGGPLAVNPDGSPVTWNLDARILDASAPGLVPYRTDLGGLGALDNATATALADRIFRIYEDIPTARIAFQNVGPTLSPRAVLQPGTYYLAVANATPSMAAFNITATVDLPASSEPAAESRLSENAAGPTLIPLTSGQTLDQQTIAGGGGGVNVQTDPQYTIEVPVGATALHLFLHAGTVDLDLFVRHGAPVQQETNGAVTFDLASQGPSGNEFLDIFPTQVPIDVTAAEVGYQIGPSPTGQNSIIFDADGSIHTALFGQNTGVLGFFQNRDADAKGHFTEGYVVLNGAWIDRDARNGEISVPAFRGIFTHEFGHFVGLDHAQVNGDLGGLYPQALRFPGFTRGEQLDLVTPFDETLFPFVYFFFDTGQSDLAAQGLFYNSLFTNDVSFDERLAVSTMYPEPGFLTAPGSPTGGIEGRVLRADALTPVSGIDVVVRRVDGPLGPSPFPPKPGVRAYPGPVPVDDDGIPAEPPVAAATDSLATAANVVSGAFGPGFALPGSPSVGSGLFHFEGLPPGTYHLAIEELLSGAVGGSGIGPFSPQLMLLREESWSGAGESPSEQFALPLNAGFANGGFESADMSAFRTSAEGTDTASPLVVTAGQVARGIDVLLETPSPEGDVRRIGSLGTTAPIAPPEGLTQLLITNAAGFAGSVAQRFAPPEGARALSFRMDFLTNESTPDPDFNDRAILTTEAPVGRLDAAVLADTTSQFSPVNESTGFAQGTGWRTVTVGDLDLLPPGDPLTLRWSVVDGQGPGVASGLLLDDVKTLSAEPPDMFASALPGLMSFANWGANSYPTFTPAATSGSDRSHVTLASGLAADNVVGYWLSPPDMLPWRPDSVYRLRFHLRSDQGDARGNPLVRLRVFTANAKAWLEQRLESTPSSVVSPTAGGSVAEVWFDPPDLSADQGDETLDDMLVAFEVIDFASDRGGVIALDRVEVDRFDRAALSARAAPLRTYSDFTDGDIAVGPELRELGLRLPSIDPDDDRVNFETAVENPEDAMGFYGEVFSVNNPEAAPGDLVRVTFNLSTEGDPAMLTRLRPRVIFGADQQLNAALDIFPRALGADPTGFAPLPRRDGGRDYAVYLPVPVGAGVQPVIGWAMGVVDFEPDRGGRFALNRVDIERIDLTDLR